MAPRKVLKGVEAAKASKGTSKGGNGQSKANAWPTPGEANARGKGKSLDAAQLRKQA